MEPEQKSNGALVGSVIIIIILILGGIYYLKTTIKSPIQNQSTNLKSDTAEIEAELNGMNLDSIDSEI